MDDPLLVCGLNAFGNLNEKRDGLIDGKGAAPNSVGERLALDVLHDEEIHTLLFTNVVQGADVGMIELRDRLCLTLETGSSLRTLGQMLGEHFDRHRPVEAGVSSFVDLTRYSQIVLKHKNIFNRSKDDLAPCGKVEK